MRENSVLLIVDVQNDFCPGGTLPVPAGDEVVPVLNRYIERFRKEGLPIIATRDWHPEKTSHFKAFGGIWPVHCVQGSEGAQFHPALMLPDDAIIISKGMDPTRDDYSALHGADSSGTPLPQVLKKLGIQRIYIGGLTTDYCVKESTLEGLRQGFAVTVLTDAVRGVDLKPGDSEKALAEIKAAGAETTTFETLLID
jgi:nicotinamidase/pyrazinamidase